MMESLTIILGALLLLGGFVFCVFPVFPGPILAYGALFTLFMSERIGAPSTTMIVICGIFTVVVVGLDMVMPSVGAKKFDCSKLGVWGSLIGAIAGVFFFPWGLILGPFIGAFVGELIAGKKFTSSIKGAMGAFVGFATGVVLKIEWCLLLMVYYLYILIF